MHWLRTIELYSSTVLETRGPTSRCQQVYAPSEDSREESVLASSSFSWLRAILGVPSLGSITPISASVFTKPSFLCVSVYSSYKDTNHIGFRNHANPVGPHLIIYICKDPISKSGHILRFCVDVNLGGKGGQLFNALQSLYLGLFYRCLGVKDNEFVSNPVYIAC